MFDLFRSRDKAMRYFLGVLLGLVALSMVITLIPGFDGMTRADEQTVAEVGGEPISITEVQSTLAATLRERKVPPEMMQFYVPQYIDQMITERALAYEAHRLGFRVTEEETANAIRSMLSQLFQGGFNREAYARFLQQQGMTIPQFERNVQKNLLLLKLQNIPLEGVLVPRDEVEKEYRRRNEKVKLEYVNFTPDKLRAQVSVTPQEMQDYFSKNKANFKTNEKRSFDLLIADETRIASSIDTSDAALKQIYETNRARYTTSERVHVRHILIKTLEKPKEELPKLEAKANDLLKQIRAGADFAALAAKHSEDTGSAQKGGDLDWLVRGQTVKPFEDSAFSLKPKEISNVVKTEYGFHILQTLEKESARVKPFEEVKAELATEQKRQLVYDKMQEAMEQARAELVRNPKLAAQVAAKHNLIYVDVKNVGPNESVPELGSNRELMNAIAALKPGELSQVFQPAPTKLALAGLTGIEAVRQAEFAEVENQIRETLISQKADQLAQQKVTEAKAKLKAGASLPEIAKLLGAEVATSEMIARDGSIPNVGPATYFAAAYEKPEGTILEPVSLGSQTVFIRSIAKEAPDMAKFAAESNEILLGLKRKKAAERKEIFEEGLVTRLEKEGKIKKYPDVIRRLVGNQG